MLCFFSFFPPNPYTPGRMRVMPRLLKKKKYLIRASSFRSSPGSSKPSFLRGREPLGAKPHQRSKLIIPPVHFPSAFNHAATAAASSIVTSSSSGSGGFCTLCLFCMCRRQLSFLGNDFPPPCLAYAHPGTVQWYLRVLLCLSLTCRSRCVLVPNRLSHKLHWCGRSW